MTLPPIQNPRNSSRYQTWSSVPDWYDDVLGPWDLPGCPWTPLDRYNSAMENDYYPAQCDACGDWCMVVRADIGKKKCWNRWTVYARTDNGKKRKGAENVKVGCEGTYRALFPLPKVRRRKKFYVHPDRFGLTAKEEVERQLRALDPPKRKRKPNV